MNKEKTFSQAIDWNFIGYGKLWAYNLNYFDFLHQEDIQLEDALRLIDSFCQSPAERWEGTESYPISLRGINWIKFFSKHQIQNSKYDAILVTHYQYLINNLEYHLMGNHLLENGFSLLFGAYYFKDDGMYGKAFDIVLSELQEQVKNDGAHFELSPMYHQILFYRLLDCINLVKNNPWKNDDLLSVMTETAKKMAGWLVNITFSDGTIPMVSDSAPDIAPTSEALLKYAERLSITPLHVNLSDSGYRMIKRSDFELFLDVGDIGPNYIPGHGHSDTFNFLVNVHGQPLIVDTGVSTYDVNVRRELERSSVSHNTIVINNESQSQVWASFRVGQRAKVFDLKEEEGSVTASHNGYKRWTVIHTREWRWSSNEIRIKDRLVQSKRQIKSTAYIHLHPSIVPAVDNTSVDLGCATIQFGEGAAWKLDTYYHANGFNSLEPATCIIIDFDKVLTTTIRIKGIST